MLKGLLQNKREAIETIYKQHYNIVQSLILNNSGNTEEAEDIFQEAHIVSYEKVKSGSFELNCQIKTYLYSVCRRLWLKRLNQLQRFSPSARPDYSDHIATIALDQMNGELTEHVGSVSGQLHGLKVRIADSYGAFKAHTHGNTAARRA